MWRSTGFSRVLLFNKLPLLNKLSINQADLFLNISSSKVICFELSIISVLQGTAELQIRESHMKVRCHCFLMYGAQTSSVCVNVAESLEKRHPTQTPWYMRVCGGSMSSFLPVCTPITHTLNVSGPTSLGQPHIPTVGPYMHFGN